MAKRSPATHVSVLISDISSARLAGQDDGLLFVDMSLKLGRQDIANDLLYGACQVLGRGDAFQALRDLMLDQGKLGALVQQHMADEVLKADEKAGIKA
jgi:hypothetical protein